MKKTSKFKSKKYPRLKKYADGDVVESAAITEQKRQQEELNAQARQDKNAATVAKGAGAALGAYSAYQSGQAGQGTKAQRDAASYEGVIDSFAGTALPWYALAKQGSDLATSAVPQKTITNKETGEVVTDYSGTSGKQAAAVFKPQHEMAVEDLSSGNTGLAVAEMFLPGLGYESRSNALGMQKGINKLFGSEENDAAANFAKAEAANKAYDEQQKQAYAAQQAQQKEYNEQMIQSGIKNYYGNPDKSQTFAMGGIPQMPNGEVEGNEMITSNTRPQTFGAGGVELASNNPYGTPTWKTDGPAHTDGGMPISMAPGSVINGKTINPMTGNKFTKDIDAIAKMENKFTKKAESGDKYSRTMAKLMLPTLAMKKEKLNELQKYVIANNEERKALKNGIIPSRDNEMSEPQGMPEQAEGEMVMARYGAQMPIYDEEAVEYKDGGIHIKPENRGKFTAYKERTGKTTAEALQSPNAHVRQMANFARNAAKWKHEMGGEQGLPMYENGITPNWYTPYFPKPEYSGAPGFANPNKTNAPFITKEEQNQLAWEDMNRRGQANELAAIGQQPQVAPSPVEENPSYNNIYPRVSSTPSPFITPRELDRLQYENDVRKVTEQGMANKGAGQQPPPDPKNYSNYADYAAAAAQLAGPITGLIQNKPPALQNYVAPQASLLSSTEAMRQANIEANAARKALKDMTGGNVGQQLGNLGSVAARNALAKAQTQERYDNANAQIMNRNAEIAADYANKSIDKRDADLANYRNLNTKYIGDIGTGLANVNRDANQTRYDQDYLDWMEIQYPQAYAKYKADKKKNSKTNNTDIG